jgi:hypothetical protein
MKLIVIYKFIFINILPLLPCSLLLFSYFASLSFLPINFIHTLNLLHINVCLYIYTIQHRNHLNLLRVKWYTTVLVLLVSIYSNRLWYKMCYFWFNKNHFRLTYIYLRIPILRHFLGWIFTGTG